MIKKKKKKKIKKKKKTKRRRRREDVLNSTIKNKNKKIGLPEKYLNLFLIY
jgi:hypothetical protein